MQQIVNSAATLTAGVPTRRLIALDLEELKPERVQETLKAMPGWKLDMNRRTIDRFYEFPDSKVALVYAAFATELAGSWRQPISILVAGGRVGLTLHGKPRRGKRGGLTEAVMELAKRLG
jgi:pterin-4a-carbinolamine dehydratase